jgi:hypothetical protein
VLLFPTIAYGSPLKEKGGEALSGIFQSGLVFYDLFVPLTPLNTRKTQTLTAVRAEVLVPPNLLETSGFHITVKEPNTSPFSFRSKTAVYDFKSGAIHASNGFSASSSGLNFEGVELWRESETPVFDAIGHLEVQLEKPASRLSPDLITTGEPAFHFGPLPVSRYELPNPMAPLELVQKFSGNLSSFLKCWRWTGAWDSTIDSSSESALAAISSDGGHIDLQKVEIQLAGPSAIIGRQAVLISAGGIQMHQENSDDYNLVRMTGQGGVQTWIHAPKSNELWIRSTRFDCVSDRRIIQFKGGPLTIGRRGAILTATEDWQFVRVFPNGRIVLSPGAWTSTGNFILRRKKYQP